MPSLVAILLIGMRTLVAATAPHAWSERVCIPWAGERRCLTYTDVTSQNMNSLVASTLAGICARTASSQEAFSCCTDPGCVERFRLAIHRRLRWGARISDPVVALSARRSGVAERLSEGSHLSGHHHDLFDLALDSLLAELDNNSHNDDAKRYILFVQAGSHVGALEHDPIYPFVMAEPRARALLFEPSSPQFEALTYNYRAAGDRVRLVHAAVCARNGEARFRQSRVPAGNASDPAIHEDLHCLSPLYDYLYRTMHSQAGMVTTHDHTAAATAAADQRLGDDSTNYTEPPAEWTEVTVQCARLHRHLRLLPSEWEPSLLHASVLVVDAEGSDSIVLREALCGVVTPALYPRLVLFEHTGMTPAQKVDAIALLDRYGYTCQPSTMLDALCTLPAEFSSFLSTPRPACCQLDSSCAPICQPGVAAAVTAAGNNGDDDNHWGYCEDSHVDKKFPSGRQKGAVKILVDGVSVEVAAFERRHPQNDATIAALKHRLSVKDFPQLAAALIALWKQQTPGP